MPFPLLIPLALGGASFLGGLFGGGGKRNTTSTTTPTLDPAYAGIRDMLVSNISKRLQGSALPEGLAERNIADINKTYDLAGTGLSNRLAARGLGTSPIAGAAEGVLGNERASEIVRMQQSLPILQRQMEMDNIAQAIQALQGGRGSTTVEEGGGGAGSRIGSGISGLASMLGFLYGSGMFGGGTVAPGTGGGSGLPAFMNPSLLRPQFMATSSAPRSFLPGPAQFDPGRPVFF